MHKAVVVMGEQAVAFLLLAEEEKEGREAHPKSSVHAAKH